MSEEIKSAMDERVPALKGNDFKNTPRTIKFEKLEPVWEQDYNFDGKKVTKYGFALIPQDENASFQDKCNNKDADFMFMTEKGREFIDLAYTTNHISAKQNVILELKTGTSKDGKNFTIWTLNGKSARDMMESDGTEPQKPTEDDDPMPFGGKEQEMVENIEGKSALTKEQVADLSAVRDKFSEKVSGGSEPQTNTELRQIADNLLAEHKKYKEMGMDIKPMFDAHCKILELIDGVPF